jgi:antagonist of KipI
MSLLVHKPGLLASIQDSGRYGYQHWGIPICGAMDIFSMQAANLICGNNPNSAVIECTLHGTSIAFQQRHQFAITGGGAIATLNNKMIAFNQLISAAAGDLLQLHPSPDGCRSYLAVAGGFAIEAELNSCSTYALANLGGINGCNLKAGDTVPTLGQKKEKDNQAAATPNTSSNYKSSEAGNEESTHLLLKKALDNPALTSHQVTIKCYQGPEWNWFSHEAQERFATHCWSIGNNSNRMGYSLIGPSLEKNNTQELISTAVTRGIVQVTPSGIPIVLMADAQTIGGYPRIARIAENDITTLAQCRPGYHLTFQLQR